MTLPLVPPIKPQLARTAKALPEGDEWSYEPKYDGFRMLAYRDGDEAAPEALASGQPVQWEDTRPVAPGRSNPP